MPISQGSAGGLPGANLKAWVRFDGTGAIIGSLNVASVNRTAQGNYTVNFSTPMATVNYVGRCTPGALSTGASILLLQFITATTGAASVRSVNGSGVGVDGAQLWEFYE